MRDNSPGVGAPDMRKESVTSDGGGTGNNRMVSLTIGDGYLTLRVEGLDQLLVPRSKLTIPLRHISGEHAGPEIARA